MDPTKEHITMTIKKDNPEELMCALPPHFSNQEDKTSLNKQTRPMAIPSTLFPFLSTAV